MAWSEINLGFVCYKVAISPAGVASAETFMYVRDVLTVMSLLRVFFLLGGGWGGGGGCRDGYCILWQS